MMTSAGRSFVRRFGLHSSRRRLRPPSWKAGSLSLAKIPKLLPLPWVEHRRLLG
jgi:hypothetical protein